MISVYVREQKRYAQKDLCKLLCCSGEKVIPIIEHNEQYEKMIKSRYSLLQKKEMAKRHIEVINMSKGKNLNTHIATIKMKNGMMFKYELNTRRKKNAVVLLETSSWK